MTRVGYFDLANGISGDMILAAIAHAGRKLGIDAESAIVAAVSSLPFDVAIAFTDDDRGGIACLRAEVKTDGERYTARELRTAVEASPRALRALDLLVDAEASVHGVDPEDVHLHELASADTAADLLGAAVGLKALGIGTLAAAPVPVPSGWVASEHGPLPLPAPATLEILRGALLRGMDDDTELVTPSGAAILVAHDATFGPLPQMTLEATGIAAGGRTTTKRPNLCRLLVGAAAEEIPTDECVLLEANIDDQTPEALGHAIEALLSTGALDAWVTPIVMKKSRPAFGVSVLARPQDEAAVAEAFFRLTTTLGIRRRTIQRHVLDREHVTVDVDGREVRVKVARLRGEVVNLAPEFADCVRAAEALGVPVKDVHYRAMSQARSTL